MTVNGKNGYEIPEMGIFWQLFEFYNESFYLGSSELSLLLIIIYANDQK